mmetsp:Transcript_12681/g.16370  ORF Transcript_12681/g.16370 Transcript_12681/m.16370 type:complete len:88 (+) Transcript_12681:286-549(+)
MNKMFGKISEIHRLHEDHFFYFKIGFTRAGLVRLFHETTTTEPITTENTFKDKTKEQDIFQDFYRWGAGCSLCMVNPLHQTTIVYVP